MLVVSFITLIVFSNFLWHEYISSFGASSDRASKDILNVVMESVSKLWPVSKPKVSHILVNLHYKSHAALAAPYFCLHCTL